MRPKTKWTIYNEHGKKIKSITITHKDGGIYKELEPFEKTLTQNKQHAIRKF